MISIPILSKIILHGGNKFNSEIKRNLDWLQSIKQFFINESYDILVASLTLMALFYRAIRVRLATSIWYDTLMKNCFKDWSQSYINPKTNLLEEIQFNLDFRTKLIQSCWYWYVWYYLYCIYLPARVIFANKIVWAQIRPRRSVGPDLDSNCLTLWFYSWEIVLKKLIWKTKSEDDKTHVKFPSMQIIKRNKTLWTRAKKLNNTFWLGYSVTK